MRAREREVESANVAEGWVREEAGTDLGRSYAREICGLGGKVSFIPSDSQFTALLHPSQFYGYHIVSFSSDTGRKLKPVVVASEL